MLAPVLTWALGARGAHRRQHAKCLGAMVRPRDREEKGTRPPLAAPGAEGEVGRERVEGTGATLPPVSRRHPDGWRRRRHLGVRPVGVARRPPCPGSGSLARTAAPARRVAPAAPRRVRAQHWRTLSATRRMGRGMTSDRPPAGDLTATRPSGRAPRPIRKSVGCQHVRRRRCDAEIGVIPPPSGPSGARSRLAGLRPPRAGRSVSSGRRHRARPGARGAARRRPGSMR